MSNKNFNSYSKYYNEINVNKNYKDESIIIGNILSNAGICTGSILEFGCGTGVHAKYLASMGYHVHGVDLSHEMVAGVELVTGFTCQQGDIRTISIDKKFNAVLALFHVISYMTENSDVRAVFDNAYNQLQQDGLFIFDFWYTPAVLHQKPETRLKRVKLDGVELLRFAEPVINQKENIVDVNYSFIINDSLKMQLYAFKELHRMRHFTLPEIRLYAELSGFKVQRFQDLVTGEEASENTWGVSAILIKA